MEILYSINQADLVNNLKKIEKSPDVKSVLLLMTDDGICNPIFMNPLLSSLTKPIVGGVFPEIIVNSERKNIGALVIPLHFYLKTEIFEFQTTELSYFEKMETIFSENITQQGSIYIFEDAFTSGITDFAESLYDFFGYNFKFIGAGCGSTSFKSSPCVIHNSGIYANAAVIGVSEEPIVLGIAHGWLPISKPMRVTETDSNKVISIDWKPAVEVYKSIIEDHSGRKLENSEFIEITDSYPFGLVKIGDEMVVRDTMDTKNGAIQFFNRIENGEYIRVLHGNTNSLLNGANIAKNKCFENVDKNKDIDKDKEYIFCIDCFTRVRFLKDDFTRELEVISDKQNIFGVIAFAEIANNGDSYLEIYNKTVIVARWNQKI